MLMVVGHRHKKALRHYDIAARHYDYASADAKATAVGHGTVYAGPH